MTDDALDQSGDDAAEAFVALKAEVAALRTLVAAAVEGRPDYTPTLGVMVACLSRIERHPGLKLTPQAYAAELRATREAARREGEQAVMQAASRVSAAAGLLERMVDQARTADRQNWRLVQVGAAGLIGGAVAWAALSGPIARRLPEGWYVPERMAAATLGMDRRDAGERLISSVDPTFWAAKAQALGGSTENKSSASAPSHRHHGPGKTRAHTLDRGPASIP